MRINMARVRFFSSRLIAIAMVFAIADCSTLGGHFIKQPSVALPPVSDTPSSLYVTEELSEHGQQSGFRLLSNNTNALLSRIAMVDQARHSIDLQYYIFKNDATGRLLATYLLMAADRGVRIRMLIDDIHLNDEVRMFNALGAHPNIQIRIFNPFTTPNPSFLSKVGQLLLEWHDSTAACTTNHLLSTTRSQLLAEET
jgi:putative cardiolipin synthase